MLKRFCILMIIFTLFFGKSAFCSSVSALNNSDDSITVRLKAGMITEAEFPQPIANVTKSISSASLQIETLGNRMFLLPLENFDSSIHVVTQDNASYVLHLIMDDEQNVSRIKINKRPEAANEEQSKETVNTVELMKTLLKGRVPKGAASSKPELKEIFNNGKLRIAIDEVYELAGGVKAFVVTFENLGDKPVIVPIEEIELPGLLAISVDSSILEARPFNTNKKPLGSTTKAYMIVEGLANENSY